MKQIFVNLKRFDVPRDQGGVCPVGDPVKWIEWVINESIEIGLGSLPGMPITFFPPESLIASAVSVFRKASEGDSRGLAIGCQGVFREDIIAGRNFGAFTTNLPAKAAKNLGCTWAIIGHSEERKDKQGIMSYLDAEGTEDPASAGKISRAVGRIVSEEVRAALLAGLKVLLCIGETAYERGEGSLDEQRIRIEEVLSRELEICLGGVSALEAEKNVVIGYEPVWAIGPGKIPPDADYIGYVSSFIKRDVERQFGFTPEVVYGGGLKRENSAQILNIGSIDGGLVALTRFTGEIGFSPRELLEIIAEYLSPGSKQGAEL